MKNLTEFLCLPTEKAYFGNCLSLIFFFILIICYSTISFYTGSYIFLHRLKLSKYQNRYEWNSYTNIWGGILVNYILEISNWGTLYIVIIIFPLRKKKNTFLHILQTRLICKALYLKILHDILLWFF